jgi:CSLREA domain-containing protein
MPFMHHVLAVMALLGCAAAAAATIDVTTRNDEFGSTVSLCSLREAVQAANTNAAFGGCPAGSASGFDVINLPAGRYQLDLGGLDENANAEGDLDITSAMIINGPDGATRTIIESGAGAGNRDRIFDLRSAAAALYVVGITLHGGEVAAAAEPDGGVIRRAAGDLRLIRSVVSGGLARHGGGIYSNGLGEVQIIQSTIFGNTATGVAGGLYAVSNVETLLSNTTVSGNFAGSGAGGISTTGNLRLNSSTVAFNRNASSGSGGLAYTGTPENADSVRMYNSIFAENADTFGGSNSDISCLGDTLHGGGYNLIQRTTCELSQPNGSFTGDAKLSPLFDFGGGVPTHALLAGSDALDAAAPSSSGAACPPADARGVARPDNACDVGAYEQAYDFSVNTASDAPDNNLGDGLCRTAANQCSLRAAIQEANQTGGRHMIRLPAGNYSINLPGSDGAGGDLDIKPVSADGERQIAVFGAGANASRIVGTGVDRIFDIHGDFGAQDVPTAVALIGVTISGGHVAANAAEHFGGGVHLSNADLLLVDAMLAGNLIEDGDGGGLGIHDANLFSDSVPGRARFERVAVIDNISRETPNATQAVIGGGVHVQAGSLFASNSTFSHNQSDFGGGASIYGNYASATLINVTVAANHVTGNGGGLYSVAPTQLKNSIVAGNDSAGNGAPDCYADNDPLLSLGYNIVGDASDCTVAGDIATNLVNVDARLTPLVRSGNPLPTHFLYTGSPALNLVPSSQCADASLLRNWHDQNYASRPAPGSSACDAGASEGTSDFIFVDDFE